MTIEKPRSLNSFVYGVSLVFVLGSTSLLASPPLVSQALVNTISMPGLLAQGWQIIERKAWKTRAPGEFPYEKLEKINQHNVYVLKKHSQRYRCEFAYDSQREKMTEICALQIK